jgi:localization factor PodJL
MRYVPWHVRGVRPEMREAARVAARRSGLSVGAWLNIAKVWRHDLEEINATLRDAMSTSAIAALEEQVRALRDRLEEHSGAAVATVATADVEQALTDIRDRLKALTPAEELGELVTAVSLLSSKADSIAKGVAPEKIDELEHAIGALQSLASQVASQDIVAALSSEIKALSDKIDHNSRPAADADLMSTLERRLAEIAQAVGAGIDTQSDRWDGADHRMDEVLAQLRELREQNERRLAAIQQQIATSAADAISSPAESIRRDVASLKEIQTSVDRRTADTFEAVYGTIEQMVDRLAVIENELRDRHFVTHPDRLADEPERCSEPHHPSRATAMLRHAAVPAIAPDASLGPDSGARRVHLVANAIDRIAASEAASGVAKPAETSEPVRARFVAAARRAAQDVVSEQRGASPPPYPPLSPTPPSPARGGGSGRWAGESREGGKPGRHAAQNFVIGTLVTWLRPRAKSLVLGVAMALLMFGAVHIALDFFHAPAAVESVQSATRTDDAAERGAEWVRSERPQPNQPPTSQGDVASRTSHITYDASALGSEIAVGQAPPRAISPDAAVPAMTPTSAATQALDASRPPYAPPRAGEDKSIYPPPPAAEGRVWGAAASQKPDGPSQATAGREPASPDASSPALDLTAMPLPPTIGGKALQAAASAGDPGACYEVAMRFAHGHNAAQDLTMAAAWLERAARSGLAPAQFRLGSMYEKGLGVKKDLAEAHRLYVAAAAKGHAKAMHNLAVLYAGGLDGKPDYATASHWFRRAAVHGIIDSQYNLAILYARGTGVERNFAESYKWFALAAKGGDKDAARKRDEVAARLDPTQLESARLSAESFVAVPQPGEATSIKAPPGGWDQVAAATPKPKALVTPAHFPGK